jgi:hypothetical protein
VLPRDRIGAALVRLDPQSIALLELSARKGLSDEDIAEVLQIDPADVASRREEAVSRLAADLDVAEEDRAELSQELPRLSVEDWHQTAQPPPRSARRGGFVAAGLALAVGVAALVIVIAGKDDGGETAGPKKPATPAAQTKPSPQRARPARSMQRLNGTRGRGTAQLVQKGGRALLRLRVSGFSTPSGGGYAVWFFSSRTKARRLYATRRTAIKRDLPLPADYSRYRFVEVARAIPRLNSPHSGVTLLRVPVSTLK